MTFKDIVTEVILESDNVNCCAEEIIKQIEDQINDMLYYIMMMKEQNKIDTSCYNAVIKFITELRGKLK
ncbi:MAG: hypothetical protein K0S93_10 [Nitrososphaeraceae archaeon]|nr:hypothetical protein [Nitrososphaeraceae archaeon]